MAARRESKNWTQTDNKRTYQKLTKTKNETDKNPTEKSYENLGEKIPSWCQKGVNKIEPTSKSTQPPSIPTLVHIENTPTAGINHIAYLHWSI